MKYNNRHMINKSIIKRFVKDYNLPIPVVKEDYIPYYLDLYEEDFGSRTKFDMLLNTIEEIKKKYGGDDDMFLDYYYEVRNNVINAVVKNPSFKKFNNMDMNEFSIKDKPNVSSNNIYNETNVGKFFISIDLKKANFQTLKNIDNEIVFGADTYEDFIHMFTPYDYFTESKYFRQVISGQMNPKRHITAEKYFMNVIYNSIVARFPNYVDKLVSFSNDEIVFKDDFLLYNDKLTCFTLRRDIEKICKDLGFEVHVEFFFLRGYHFNFKTSGTHRTNFYYKDYIFTDGKFKLIAAPLPYHALMYKMFRGKEIEEMDYHFDYKGIDAKFNEKFEIEEI